MSEFPRASGPQNKRRSQRIVARFRVRVVRRDMAVAEDSHTIVVNSHGALLALSMPVQHGELLILQNPISKAEIQARVVRSADNQKPGQVAVEFTRIAPHFWQIDPPADPKG